MTWLLIGVSIYALLATSRISYLTDINKELSIKDTDHAKCIGAVAGFVGDTFAAKVLRLAADDYDSGEGQARLRELVHQGFLPESGPSLPSLWLYDRADNLVADYEDGEATA